MTENNSENNIPQKENIASQNKTISYIKKNPLVIVISFIAILFFIFAAFQFFAPDNLKPIKSNSNKESSSKESEKKKDNTSAVSIDSSSNNTNKINPLVSDSQSDVYVSDKCDLAFKYLKKDKFLENVDVYISKDSSNISQLESSYKEYYQKYLLPSDVVDLVGLPAPAIDARFGFRVECYDKVYDFDTFNSSFNSKSNDGVILKRFDSNPVFDKTSVDKKYDKTKFCNDIGLTSESCKLISNQTRVILPSANGDTEYYYFTYNDKSYNFEFAAYDKNKLILQFNSLAPSVSTAQLTQSLQTITQNTSSPILLTETYTNPYFPSFKLVYDKSWRFSTETTLVSGSKVLLERTITLSKNNSSLKLQFDPQPIGGCGLGVYQPTATLEKSLSNGINKYSLKGGVNGENGGVAYIKGGNANDIGSIICTDGGNADINTNILVKDSDGWYKDAFSKDKYVKYNITINPEWKLKTSDPLITEIDKIISDSTFN